MSDAIAPPSDALVRKALHAVLAPSSSLRDAQEVLSPFTLLRLSTHFDSTPSHSDLLEFLFFTTKAAVTARLCSSIISDEPALLDDVDPEPRFTRLDPETLQASFRVQSTGILAVFQWYNAASTPPLLSMTLAQKFKTAAIPDEPITGWKLEKLSIPGDDPAALKPGLSELKGSISIEAAEAEYVKNKSHPRARSAIPSKAGSITADEDDYWAMYDTAIQDGDSDGGEEAARPGNRPAAGASTSSARLNPWSHLKTPAKSPAKSISEDDYFKQYDTVQPALDPDEPAPRQEREQSRNKQEAEATQESSPMVAHVKDTVRSLYRLAKSSGMEPAQFINLVSEVVGDEL